MKTKTHCDICGARTTLQSYDRQMLCSECVRQEKELEEQGAVDVEQDLMILDDDCE